MTGPIARRWIFAVASAWIGGALAAGVAGAQDADSLGLPPIADYSSGSDYLPQSPSVSGGAVGAFANPASWATSGRVESAFWWDDRSVRRDYLDNWGLSIGKTLGFAMRQETIALPGGPATVRDHQIGLAFGDRRGHFGFAYRWPGGDTDEIPREKAIAVGAITRPNRWVSHGLSGVFSVESDARLGVFDIGVRPLGSPLLTLFGDYSLRDDQTLEEGFWGAGVEMRPWHGLHVGAKVREAEGDDDLSYTLNLGLTFDDGGFHVLPGYDEDGDRGRTTYLLRQGVPYRGIPVRRQLESRFAKPRYYVPLDLEKKWITYQKNVWFDDNRIAWLDLARQLDRWKADPRVRGIAVNTSGLRISNSLVWEFRQQLAGMREAGKEVVVYGDRFGLMTYYLASAADRIVIDPQGEITLVGLAAHRTYWRGFLDKVGLGIEEWRFFMYKSAMETFARRDMSEPDREQIQRLIDVIYETGREDICRSRGITHEDFDSIVENDLYLPATLAIERKLADEAGRWHDLEDWLKEERKGARLGAPKAEADPSELPDERWGKPREIQVVYAIGECAMDSGIRGRATSKHMRGLAKDREVAGVVLRADSPGGDPLPSDLVAEATRKIKDAKKPVIVSQGGVAGSGGYWISLDGTKILTTPFTITGSIGVIGGWVWDDGISGKTGFTADGVQRGSHADLQTGIRFPIVSALVGAALPERNLDEKEKGIAKARIVGLYDDFVKGVARGRNIPESRVREIAEGRVWMGGDAIERGLADRFGGLTDAIAEAKSAAGLEPDEEVRITEYPKRRLFAWPRLGPSFPIGVLGIGRESESETALDDDAFTRYIRSLVEAEGSPLLRMPPEQILPGWDVEP